MKVFINFETVNMPIIGGEHHDTAQIIVFTGQYLDSFRVAPHADARHPIRITADHVYGIMIMKSDVCGKELPWASALP